MTWDSDGVRVAHGEGHARRGADVVLRRGVRAGVLRHVPAAGQPAGDGQPGDGAVPRRGRQPGDEGVRPAADVADERVRRGRRGRRRARRSCSSKAFGIVVTFDQPGVAERAMYFGTSPFWNGGHESAGVNAPSTSWFHAEGATGAFFDTFILLSNPERHAGDGDAAVPAGHRGDGHAGRRRCRPTRG